MEEMEEIQGLLENRRIRGWWMGWKLFREPFVAAGILPAGRASGRVYGWGAYVEAFGPTGGR